ncbi:Crp/Fnr family transcriptional regulator [Flavobacterium terrigena]|uniref:cAMP-binding domain of CRP or a regulatory subunit of cAMP-dependent protein kinases n=1 Tax=Flavobacterium terrigena TaxID=402734 RepID=A0A1H6X5N1_9FLAO|nr:Crp/Fnr family transcriptional regulator [Flavobacterium terrigena]SEJ19855.1 cAMP-binding domain of CRP or a regulatory subunit of cAMP-dependent protein kinases [Flavobacterium terrigena]
MEAFQILLQTLKHITTLEPDEEVLFQKAFKPFSLQKNEYFLQSTEVNTKLGFLCKGLVRYFVFKNEEEATLEFTKEGEFVADYGSFISKQPSIQNIQALEDCEFLVIDYDELQKLYKVSKNANLLGRIIIEHRFIIMVNQLLTVHQYNPEDRYRYFLEHYKDLVQRIPQYLIASYVGVKPQSLSRIRKRIV